MTERRKDYMVSRRVHLLYMLTWISSLSLVGAFVWMIVTLRNVSRIVPEGQRSIILVGALAVVIVLAALSLAVFTIVHTHRLMGSAYRIGVVLKEVNAGQPTRVHLRDGDFFTDIADEINVLADRADGRESVSAAAPQEDQPST